MPDYDPIKEDFKVLAELDCIDELVVLTKRLLELSTEQIEDCNLPGETYDQLRDCMGVAGEALNSSDLTPAQKVISFWEWQLADDYDLIDEVPDPTNDKKLKQDDWRSIADHFIDRLQTTPVQNDQVGFISSYRRSRILDKVVLALKSANAIPQAIELMEEELPHCQNHVELVELLIEIEDFDRAKHWVVSGRREFQDSYRGIESELLKKWREIAILQDDLALAASVTIFFFIDDCGATTYEHARDACQKVGKWDQIRPLLLNFLETGIFDPTDPNWPLPPTGFDDIDRHYKKSYHPRYREIINIALAENRMDDAVDWFHKAPVDRMSGFGVEIAPKIKDSHPEVALNIWKRKIHSLIEETKVRAYEEAMPYLKQVRDLMSENGQGAEYEQFVVNIRTAHGKKRRLMQELDMLEQGHKKILSG